MEPLDIADLNGQALLLMDTAPIVYFLENHPRFAPLSHRCSKRMPKGAFGLQ